MMELVLHDVDQNLIERLATRALQTGRSVEDEAKALLQESVGLSRTRAAEAARRIRASYGGRKFSDSAELIREDR
jgi:plasmid stability protein